MLKEGGMKERGMTGAGRPQITGVPRVHRRLQRIHGRGTGNIIPCGQTSGIPLTPRTMIHGSVVMNGTR